MATEKFSNWSQSTLVASIDASQPILAVASASTFPSQPQFRIKIESELMLVTTVDGVNFYVTRGIEGTTAAAHSAGATVIANLTAGALDQLKVDSQSAVWFGDGSDGNLSISSGNTIVTRTTFYNNLTISSSGVLLVQFGATIYVNGNLDVSACTMAAQIAELSTVNEGGNPGYPVNDGSYHYGIPSTAGRDSLGWGGKGGNGGGPYASRGGSVRPYPYRGFRDLLTQRELGGGGGGAGGAYAVGTGAVGGAGGWGAPGIRIIARHLIRSSSNAAGTIKSLGGDGNPAALNTNQNGSGAGAGGGAIVLVVGSLSGSSCTSFLQSIGGNGNAMGNDSYGGDGGTCILWVVGSNEVTAGPTAASGVNGGTTSLTV